MPKCRDETTADCRGCLRALISYVFARRDDTRETGERFRLGPQKPKRIVRLRLCGAIGDTNLETRRENHAERGDRARRGTSSVWLKKTSINHIDNNGEEQLFAKDLSNADDAIFLVEAGDQITVPFGQAEAVANQKASGHLQVQGQVKRSGVQQLRKDEQITLEEAVQRAGGFDQAASKRIRVTRFDANKNEYHSLTKDLREKDSEDAKFLVEAGEEVFAIEKGDAAAVERKTRGEFLITGFIGFPGAKVLVKNKNITLEEAINWAGGFSIVASRKVQIRRVDANGEVQLFRKYLRGQTEDGKFLVEAGDLVYVEEIID